MWVAIPVMAARMGASVRHAPSPYTDNRRQHTPQPRSSNAPECGCDSRKIPLHWDKGRSAIRPGYIADAETSGVMRRVAIIATASA